MAGQRNLPGDITESVGIASTNAIGQQPATLANLSLGNLAQNINGAQESSVSMQQSQNTIQATTIGTVVATLTSLKPLQAMSAQQILTGNSVAQGIIGLKAAVAGLNGGGKTSGGGKKTGGGTTPGSGGGSGGGSTSGGAGSTPSNPITGGNVYVKPVRDVNIIVEELDKTSK